MINRWNEEIKKYWIMHHEMHTYHWVHEIFEKLLASDDAFGRQWTKVVKYYSDDPHFISDNIKSKLGAMKLGINDIIEMKEHMDNVTSPLYKLPHQLNKKYRKIGNFSVLDYLVNTIL